MGEIKGVLRKTKYGLNSKLAGSRSERPQSKPGKAEYVEANRKASTFDRTARRAMKGRRGRCAKVCNWEPNAKRDAAVTGELHFVSKRRTKGKRQNQRNKSGTETNRDGDRNGKGDKGNKTGKRVLTGSC